MKTIMLILTACFFILFTLPSLGFSQSQPLSEFSDDGLKFSLSSSDVNLRRLVIKQIQNKPNDKPLNLDVFVVENPFRLVIDIPNWTLRTVKTLNINDGFISAIRTGKHLDKIRLVLDIKTFYAPHFLVTEVKTEKEFVVDIDFSKQSETAVSSQTSVLEKTKEETVSEISSSSESSLASSEKSSFSPASSSSGSVESEYSVEQSQSSSQSSLVEAITKLPQSPSKITGFRLQEPASSSSSFPPDVEEIKQPTQEKTIVETQAVSEEMSEASSVSYLKGIYYQTSKNSDISTVMLDIEPLIETCTLKKKSKGIYELTLEGAALAGDYLTLPQFPPDTFSGFEVIRASASNNNVLIEIFVEDNITISLFRAKDHLWIKADKGK